MVCSIRVFNDILILAVCWYPITSTPFVSVKLSDPSWHFWYYVKDTSKKNSSWPEETAWSTWFFTPSSKASCNILLLLYDLFMFFSWVSYWNLLLILIICISACYPAVRNKRCLGHLWNKALGSLMMLLLLVVLILGYDTLSYWRKP
jgi:hypothetical protein